MTSRQITDAEFAELANILANLGDLPELTVSTDHFNRSTDFVIVTPVKSRRLICRLVRDYNVKGDGILWAMQRPATIRDSYTAEDAAYSARIESMAALHHGDFVTVEGKAFKLRIQGDYSDAAILDAI